MKHNAVDTQPIQKPKRRHSLTRAQWLQKKKARKVAKLSRRRNRA